MLAPPPATQRTTRVGLGILALGSAITMLYFGRAFFITVIIAAMIAFLLDPGVEFFVKLRLPRGLASFVVCSISLMVLYLAGVRLYTESAAKLPDDLPIYGDRINELVDQVVTRVERVEEAVYRTLIPKRLQQQTQVPLNRRASRPPAEKRRLPCPRRLQPPSIQEVRIRPEPTPLVDYFSVYFRSLYNVLLMASFVPFLLDFSSELAGSGAVSRPVSFRR